MKSFRLWRKRLFGAVWWFSNNVSEVADPIVTLCLCVEFACSGSAWVPSWYSSFHLESTSMGLMVSGNNTVSMGVSVDYCVPVGPALNWQRVQVVPFLCPNTAGTGSVNPTSALVGHGWMTFFAMNRITVQMEKKMTLENSNILRDPSSLNTMLNNV